MKKRNRQPAYRPEWCHVCHRRLDIKPIGRPRKYCSDRCRQRWCRTDVIGYLQPLARDKRNRRAERELRRIERTTGLVDPDGTWRKLILVRLGIGVPVSWCQVCKRTYHPSLPGSSNETCSPKCRAALTAHNRAVWNGLGAFAASELSPQVAVRMQLGLPLKVCDHCGKPYTSEYKHQRFCSNACRNKHWRENRRRCARCGKGFNFNPANANKRFCSKRCYKSVARRLRKGKVIYRGPRPCVDCGRIFDPHPRYPSQRHCSPQCSRAYERRNKFVPSPQE